MTLGVERAALGGTLTMTMVIPKRSRVDGVWAYGQYIPVPRGSYWYNEVDSTLRRRGRSATPTLREPAECGIDFVVPIAAPRYRKILSVRPCAIDATPLRYHHRHCQYAPERGPLDCQGLKDVSFCAIDERNGRGGKRGGFAEHVSRRWGGPNFNICHGC